MHRVMLKSSKSALVLIQGINSDLLITSSHAGLFLIEMLIEVLNFLFEPTAQVEYVPMELS